MSPSDVLHTWTETSRVRRVCNTAVDDLVERVDALALGVERVHEMHPVFPVSTMRFPSCFSPANLEKQDDACAYLASLERVSALCM